MAFASLNGVYSKDSGSFNAKDFIERTLTRIEIPRGVSRIGPGAYMGCTKATGAVTLPESVKRIEMNGFADCVGISELKLPNGLEYIGGSAFTSTYSLEKLVLPPLINTLSSTLARGSGIREFVAEGAIFSIAGAVFSDCTKCLSYDFTACTSVPTLANVNAFNNINPDAEIFVPSELFDEWIVATNWAQYADHIVGVGANHYGLLDFEINDSGDAYTLVGIGTYDSIGELTDLIIPETHESLPVTSIAPSAFEADGSLGRVTIPNTVTSIGASSFSGCTNLAYAYIPESVTSIGAAAFADCPRLTEVYFGASEMADCEYTDGVFARAGQSGDGIKVVIGKSVDVVPANLFYGGYPMGDYSPKVVSVEFEEGSICRTLGDQSFYYCIDLDEFKAPATLEQIGTSALFHADVLDFSDCRCVPTLKSADLGASAIYVPAALYDEWIAATNWAQYADKIVAK